MSEIRNDRRIHHAEVIHSCLTYVWLIDMVLRICLLQILSWCHRGVSIQQSTQANYSTHTYLYYEHCHIENGKKGVPEITSISYWTKRKCEQWHFLQVNSFSSFCWATPAEKGVVFHTKIYECIKFFDIFFTPPYRRIRETAAVV